MKTILSRWDIKKVASSRAKREGSSAPIKEELDIYKKYLKLAIKGKNPRVLVLGATPELRDMAIGLGCETLAIDISFNVIESMYETMKFRDDDKNLMMRCDWLKMVQFLPEHCFDAVLADASLNNIPVKLHPELLKNINKLLKPDGYFITRNFIYLPEKPQENFSYFQKQYNQKKTTWLMFWFALGYYTKWKKKIYNEKTKEWSVKKMFDLFNPALEKGEIKLRKEDVWKIRNIEKHGGKIIHITFFKKEFENMLKKYFAIKAIVEAPRWTYTEFMPIYVLKIKK